MPPGESRTAGDERWLGTVHCSRHCGRRDVQHGCKHLDSPCGRRPTAPLGLPALQRRCGDVGRIRDLVDAQASSEPEPPQGGTVSLDEQIDSAQANLPRQRVQQTRRSRSSVATLPHGDPFSTHDSDPVRELVLRETGTFSSRTQHIDLDLRGGLHGKANPRVRPAQDTRAALQVRPRAPELPSSVLVRPEEHAHSCRDQRAP